MATVLETRNVMAGRISTKGTEDFPPFAQWLTRAIAARGLTLEDVGDAAGIHWTYVQKLRKGVKPPPKRPIVERLASALTPEGADAGIRANILNNGLLAAGYTTPESVKGAISFPGTFRETANNLRAIARQIEQMPSNDPLLLVGEELSAEQLYDLPFSDTEASAGFGRLAESSGGYETLGSQLPKGLRTIRVRGECMEPFYKNGDILLVDQDSSPQPGYKVVALLDGAAVACKMYRTEGDSPFLEATNGKYPRINAGHFEVLGVVRYVLHKE